VPGLAVLDPVDAVDLAEALDLAEAELDRKWTPLPHQIPPEGEWQVWMMEGGRGSGKTDGAAAYLDAHCMGPACVPGYPGGHNPAIIAPTLGDAVTACVNGPSGLRAHNRRVRLVQGMGGAQVRWPNGVEAKIFRARSTWRSDQTRALGAPAPAPRPTRT
jgi:phage terminase large subunit-like protein